MNQAQRNFDAIEVMRMTRLVWAKSGYRPSQGHWPINGLDDELVIESRGQQEIHDCTNRLILVSGGVRAGKSQWGAMHAIKHCFVNDGLVWIVGPDYEQADNEFDYIVKALAACDMIGSLSDPKGKSKSVITPWGCQVVTKSSKDVRTIAGKAPHFLLGVEMGQQEEAAYHKLRERAIEHGATVAMTGTFSPRSRVWWRAVVSGRGVMPSSSASSWAQRWYWRRAASRRLVTA